MTGTRGCLRGPVSLGAQVLEEEGFAVSTARDGWQALDRIAAQQPDVVLLDLQLPMLSGWGVLKQLRARWPCRWSS